MTKAAHNTYKKPASPSRYIYSQDISFKSKLFRILILMYLKKTVPASDDTMRAWFF